MAEMEEKLGAILNDPQIMQQIMTMAQSLGQGAPAPQEKPKEDSSALMDPALLQKLSGIARSSGTDHQQKTLLNALEPYLNREKLQRLERAMRAAKMAQMASSLLGNGGLLSMIGR